LSAILSRANFSGGQGGNGIVHTVGNGNNSQGPSTGWSFSARSNFWVRYYVKFPAGVVMPGSYMKDLDFDNGPGLRIIFGIQNGGWNFWQSSGTQYPMDESGTYVGTKKTWSSLMGGTAADGLWHCFEFHLDIQGTGASTAEIWIDDVACGANFNCNFTGTTGYNGWHFFVNQADVSNGPGEIHIDDIVVSDSGRIGPISGGSGNNDSFGRAPGNIYRAHLF
jgi:hypothetical protein